MGKIGIILNMFIIHRKLLACKDSFTDVIPDEINQSTFFNYPFQMSYTEHFSVDCPSTIAKLITTTHHNKEKNHELEKKKQKKNRQTTRRSGNTVTKP